MLASPGNFVPTLCVIRNCQKSGGSYFRESQLQLTQDLGYLGIIGVIVEGDA